MNPIKHARIVGEGISPELYLSQHAGVTRGHPEYILTGKDFKQIDHCPHRWREGYKDSADTASTTFGSVLDCLLMDSDSLEERFAIVPEVYESTAMECPVCKSQTDSASCRKCKTDRIPVVIKKPWDFNSTTCKEWREQQNGKDEVKAEVLADARTAASLIEQDLFLLDMFHTSRKQVMIEGVYADAATGLEIPVRCLIDVAPVGLPFLSDFKTTLSAHPRAWRKRVYEFGYHVQAARHIDLWNAATGENRAEFRHWIQENYPPFEFAKRILSDEFLSLGRDHYTRTLAKYAKCLATDEWPGYDAPTSNADLVIDGHLVTYPEPWMVI